MSHKSPLGTIEVDFGTLGAEMHALCRELYPICRSITGNGVRETLTILRRLLPQLATYEVPSGTVCFDWTVPLEWNIRDAFIIDPTGNKIVDFQVNNLHVMSYSVCVDQVMSLGELQAHLYSRPDVPDAIPYRTSYYKERWGFCITHNQRQKLVHGDYRVHIDSTLAPGHLTYAELLIPGAIPEEIMFSTYVCHPSMANNELSGPVVATFLARILSTQKNLRYTYRFIFIPETIGSIVYLSRNLAKLQKHVVAGFNVTCIGDDRCFSYLPSRSGNSLSDRVARHVLGQTDPAYKRYTYKDRGSDERQYCSPGIDLPVASIMRSKYGTYPEYHTSLDNLELVTPTGLAGGLQALLRCVITLETNRTLRTTVLCEPKMDKRGLYPTVGGAAGETSVRTRMNLLAYADGKVDLLEIAEILSEPVWKLHSHATELEIHGLLVDVT